MNALAVIAAVRQAGGDLYLPAAPHTVCLTNGQSVAPMLRAQVRGLQREIREVLEEEVFRDLREVIVERTIDVMREDLDEVLSPLSCEDGINILLRLRPKFGGVFEATWAGLMHARDAFVAGRLRRGEFLGAARAVKDLVCGAAAELATICHACGLTVERARADRLDGMRTCRACRLKGAVRIAPEDLS